MPSRSHGCELLPTLHSGWSMESLLTSWHGTCTNAAAAPPTGRPSCHEGPSPALSALSRGTAACACWVACAAAARRGGAACTPTRYRRPQPNSSLPVTVDGKRSWCAPMARSSATALACEERSCRCDATATPMRLAAVTRRRTPTTRRSWLGARPKRRRRCASKRRRRRAEGGRGDRRSKRAASAWRTGVPARREAPRPSGARRGRLRVPEPLARARAERRRVQRAVARQPCVVGAVGVAVELLGAAVARAPRR